MYCVFNATTNYEADTGNPFGWPLEENYGYFCDQRDKGKYRATISLARQLEFLSSKFYFSLTCLLLHISRFLLPAPLLLLNNQI